ncbi:hypothetical protein [Prosthecomicrobium sp. N25]|uniref:hypothetical protein n=1 Tax=Prosthecomicrobium sp. N25 TaxID=3129254 RepID=UPI0030789F6C
MTGTRPTFPAILIVLSGLVLGGAGAAVAQGNQSADQLSQQPGAGGISRGGAVHVGANTSAGTTLGNSGPKPASAKLGLTDLPPLPGADLCKGLAGTPAEADCLAKVTGK